MDKIRKITNELIRAYGKPRRFPRSDPVDELIRTILSQNTSDKNSIPAFNSLKKRFKRWEMVLSSEPRAMASVIRHAGLANIKARRIKEVLAEIKKREGRISLKRLGGMTTADAVDYLRSFKGVGPKTAACVLLFSFHKPVMPVDTHIFRVTKRLGILPHDANIEEAHKILTERCGTWGLIYDFHLCIIMHGRKTCKAQGPKCGACALFHMCAFKDKRKYAR